MRTTGLFALAAFAVALGGPSASAQTKSVPIDTSAYVVKPVDATTSIVGNSFRYVSRVAANMIDSNGFVKTVNNLLGKTTPAPAVPIQAGPSALPQPYTYPSQSYQSPLKPAMPIYGTYRR